jgi:hypothetical protein
MDVGEITNQVVPLYPSNLLVLVFRRIIPAVGVAGRCSVVPMATWLWLVAV